MLKNTVSLKWTSFLFFCYSVHSPPFSSHICRGISWYLLSRSSSFVMMRYLILLGIFLHFANPIALAATTEEDRQCWFFNDRLAPDDVPCSGKYYTHCCAKNEVCLSNGLCMNTGHQPYVLARRSCTDKAWQTGSSCTNKCHYSMQSSMPWVLILVKLTFCLGENR